MSPPNVFISATSGDLRSVRQIVKEALLTINCHPVEQTNFEPDWRTVEGMLHGKIAGCQALIHIAGLRYGAEPDPATLPPGTPRRSYTQMEYHLGCQLHAQRGDSGFRVYTFICPEDFPFDACEAEPEDKAALQSAHRNALMDNPRLYERPGSAESVQARILALQEQVLSLQQQQQDTSKEVKRSHRTLLLVLLLLLTLGGLGAGGFWLTNRRVETLPARVEDSIRRGYTVDATKIRIQLEAASEKKRDADVAEADDIKKHPKWDDRQRLREEAEEAHQLRVSRLTEFAQDFADLAAAKDASPVLIEMSRIIETEGVSAALAYFETQRGDVLKRARSRLSAAREAARRDLQPMLQAARLQATKGQTDAARTGYEELMNLDPDWPEALEAFAYYLYERSIYGQSYTNIKSALADALQSHRLAQSRLAQSPGHLPSQRLFSVTLERLGYLAVKRGDLAAAFRSFSETKTIRERLAASDPANAEGQRDLSVLLNNLGDLAVAQGDLAGALRSFTESKTIHERLTTSDPTNAQWQSDLSGSLNNLGKLAVAQGDLAGSLRNFSESKTIAQRLAASDPANAEWQRVLSISLNNLGDITLAQGDLAAALRNFSESKTIFESLAASATLPFRLVNSVT